MSSEGPELYVYAFVCVCVHARAMYLCICVCNLIMYFGKLELAILKGGGKSWSDIQNTIRSFNREENDHRKP